MPYNAFSGVAQAGDLGSVLVCYRDYDIASNLNPIAKIERDKTLMQGHEYFNRRRVTDSASIFLLDLLIIFPAESSSAAEDPGSAGRRAARQKSDPH